MSSIQPSFLTPLQSDSFDPRGVLRLLALVDTRKPCSTYKESTYKEIMHTISIKKRKMPLEQPNLKWDDNIKLVSHKYGVGMCTRISVITVPIFYELSNRL